MHFVKWPELPKKNPVKAKNVVCEDDVMMMRDELYLKSS